MQDATRFALGSLALGVSQWWGEFSFLWNHGRERGFTGDSSMTNRSRKILLICIPLSKAAYMNIDKCVWVVSVDVNIENAMRHSIECTPQSAGLTECVGAHVLWPQTGPAILLAVHTARAKTLSWRKSVEEWIPQLTLR